MRTSRLFSLALAIVPVLSVARAQAPNPVPDQATKHPPIIVAAVRASLRGINLSDTQKATVKGMDKHRPQLVVVRNSMKPWRTALQTARQNNDTAAAWAARVALRRGRFGVATITRSAVQQTRPALTTAQQAQFDANVPRVRTMLTRFVRGGPPRK